MRPFTPGSILKYSQLEHVERIDDVQHPIIREAMRLARVPDAAARNHHAGRHPCRHRPRLVGQFHDGAAQGALRAPPAPAASERARRAGLRHRDRPARASRSASRTSTSPPTAASPASRSIRDGSVDAEPLRDADGHAVQPRRQPAAVLHRLLAQRRRHPRRSEDAQRRRSDADDAREPALRQGARLSQPRRAGAGRHRRLRRADARALGAQEAPLGRHEQSRTSTSGTSSAAGTARSAASWSAPAAAGS